MPPPLSNDLRKRIIESKLRGDTEDMIAIEKEYTLFMQFKKVKKNNYITYLRVMYDFFDFCNDLYTCDMLYILRILVRSYGLKPISYFEINRYCWYPFIWCSLI